MNAHPPAHFGILRVQQPGLTHKQQIAYMAVNDSLTLAASPCPLDWLRERHSGNWSIQRQKWGILDCRASTFRLDLNPYPFAFNS